MMLTAVLIEYLPENDITVDNFLKIVKMWTTPNRKRHFPGVSRIKKWFRIKTIFENQELNNCTLISFASDTEVNKLLAARPEDERVVPAAIATPAFYPQWP